MSIDKDAVKRAASGRWQDIARQFGIGDEYLTGKHGPCPKCGGTDRWRVFGDFDQTGGALCSQCGPSIGDGFALLQWWDGCDFPTALKRVADYVGVVPTSNGNGNGSKRKRPPEPHPEPLATARIAEWCHHKPGFAPESVAAAGGYASEFSRAQAIVFPAISGDRERTVGHGAYRVDGQAWEAWKSLGERKLHTIGGSKDGLIVVGGWDRFDAAETIVKCEGIPDALAIHSLLPAEYCAVTNLCGAKSGKGAKELATAMAGRQKHLVIIHDSDQPGQDGAKTVAKHTAAVATSVKNAVLPYATEPDNGKDLRDYVLDGATWQDIQSMIDGPFAVDMSDVAADDAADDDQDDERVISNGFVTKDENGKRVVYPLRMQTILDAIRQETDNWPRFANGSLFVVGDTEPPATRWLEKTEDMFGYLHLVKPVRWHSGECMVSRAELRSAFTGTAIEYKAIESYPHYPSIAGHYYLCGDVPAGNGDHLRRFLDYFAPRTDIDRDLLQAAMMTMVWGGPGGKRPAFLITAAGRGSGKTTAAETLASPFGGCMSFSMNDNAKDMKERLLSRDGLVKRAALLDNVKAGKISSGDIEALITSQEISGKRMYVGEAGRPNTLTWFITVNGASLSKDMSQRCIPVELARPTFSRDWDAEVLAFVDAHRWQIIGDVIGALQAESHRLHRFSRWGMWERDVLEKLPEPNEAQAVIAERQAALDTDTEEAGSVADYFRERLEDLHYDADADRVFVPSKIATQWLCEATGRRFSGVAGGRYLGQQIDEGAIPCLTRNAAHCRGRGFVWCGPAASIDATTRMDLEKRHRQKTHCGSIL